MSSVKTRTYRPVRRWSALHHKSSNHNYPLPATRPGSYPGGTHDEILVAIMKADVHACEIFMHVHVPGVRQENLSGQQRIPVNHKNCPLPTTDGDIFLQSRRHEATHRKA